MHASPTIFLFAQYLRCTTVKLLISSQVLCWFFSFPFSSISYRILHNTSTLSSFLQVSVCVYVSVSNTCDTGPVAHQANQNRQEYPRGIVQGEVVFFWFFLLTGANSGSCNLTRQMSNSPSGAGPLRHFL